MRAVWVPLMGAFAVALTTIALLPASTQAQQSVTVNLTAQNNSGQTGTAVLTSEGSGTKVVITLSNAPGPHPAHIHTGACPTPGAVVFPLTSVTNGRSETTVAASIADILRAPHAINIHKSPQEIPVYTACGNVTAAARTGRRARVSPRQPPPPRPPSRRPPRSRPRHLRLRPPPRPRHRPPSRPPRSPRCRLRSRRRARSRRRPPSRAPARPPIPRPASGWSPPSASGSSARARS